MRRLGRPTASTVRRALLYGLLLAAGTICLAWMDHNRVVRSQPGELGVFLIAASFLALGLLLGARLFGVPQAAPDEGNPRAQEALGISARELAVLQALGAGRSNKEIARDLGVSPNTVKTHVSRLLEKLEASRRTEAINKARQLGILP